MKHYLVSYLQLEYVSVLSENKYVKLGGVLPIAAKRALTINEIEQHVEKYYAGRTGIICLTNVQKISEEVYSEYGGTDEVATDQ